MDDENEPGSNILIIFKRIIISLNKSEKNFIARTKNETCLLVRNGTFWTCWMTWIFDGIMNEIMEWNLRWNHGMEFEMKSWMESRKILNVRFLDMPSRFSRVGTTSEIYFFDFGVRQFWQVTFLALYFRKHKSFWRLILKSTNIVNIHNFSKSILVSSEQILVSVEFSQTFCSFNSSSYFLCNGLWSAVFRKDDLPPALKSDLSGKWRQRHLFKNPKQHYYVLIWELCVCGLKGQIKALLL